MALHTMNLQKIITWQDLGKHTLVKKVAKNKPRIEETRGGRKLREDRNQITSIQTHRSRAENRSIIHEVGDSIPAATQRTERVCLPGYAKEKTFQSTMSWVKLIQQGTVSSRNFEDAAGRLVFNSLDTVAMVFLKLPSTSRQCSQHKDHFDLYR